MNAYVANAPGADYDPTVPPGYASWSDYWNKLRYPNNDKYASICRNCRKEDKNVEGGHVEYCEKGNDGQWYYKKSKGIFITPLCAECNNPNNTKVFVVDDNDLIKTP